MVIWPKYLCILLIFSVVACARKVDDPNNFNIVINTPKNLAPRGVESLTSLPTNRVACYGISINGTSTSTPANSCTPALGLLAGFVSSGQTIKATVAKGITISIDLYLYLQPPGQNLPCPVFQPTFTNEQLPYLYLVGSSGNVPITADDTNVTINATFPGVTQNVAEQLSMSPKCKSAARLTSPTPFSISAGAQALTGSNVNMKLRIGSPAEAKVLTGTNARLIVR